MIRSYAHCCSIFYSFFRFLLLLSISVGDKISDASSTAINQKDETFYLRRGENITHAGTAEHTYSPPVHDHRSDSSRSVRRSLNEQQQHLFNAVTVRYPLVGKDNQASREDEWRKVATFDTELESSSTINKRYRDNSHAQHKEDIWLYEHWFYGMKGGIIMESGALDGIKFSTTLMFQESADWSAVHVEADPRNYHMLVHNRASSINIHAALCGESRLLHFTNDGNDPAVNGFIEFMAPSFIRKFHRPFFDDPQLINTLPTVYCLPVGKLLRMLGISQVDIWILDLEGAEESALHGTDFNAVRFNAVAIECDGRNKTKDEEKVRIMEENNFTCEFALFSCMCKHNEYKPSTALTLTDLSEE